MFNVIKLTSFASNIEGSWTQSWKENVDYMSELVVVLNHKIWEHYSHNQILAKVYDKLWRETDDFCRKHFKGEELTKYYNYID